MDSREDSPLKPEDDDQRQPSFHPFEVELPPPRNSSVVNGGARQHYSSHALADDFIKSQKAQTAGDFGDLEKGGHWKLNGTSNNEELNAMSMASLNERDIKAMDTDRTNSVGDTPLTCQNSTPKCNHCYYAPPNPFGEESRLHTSMFFADHKRSVDFVIVWKTDPNGAVEKTNQSKRAIFEENLINEGLEIETETYDEDLHFLKVHAPLEVLRRYSEILKLRMPMKESHCKIVVNDTSRRSTRKNSTRSPQKIPGLYAVKETTNSVFSPFKNAWSLFSKKCLLDEEHFPERSHRFTAIYSRDKEYLFDLQQACFFTAAIRSRIVQFVLDRKRFTEGANDDFAFGVDRLISDGAYIAAYPLHDGEVNVPGSMRNLLYTEWASISKWYRYQPLDYIKEYFGVKIGLYFAWLGFYTYMLLLASIVGIFCFVYSYGSMNNNLPSKEICSPEMDIKMCPLCDRWCDFYELRDTCFFAKAAYLIDNPSTVFFAIFMSFWATLFLEQWKRYSAEITHRWDLTGFDVHEEHPRPQYLARLSHIKKVRIDTVTDTREPAPPFWRMKVPATVFSFSMVILLVAMAFAAVLAVVLYRISVLAAAWSFTSNIILFSTASAACINLCLIFVFNYIYNFLAEYLTELELLRTQTEFDDSLTLKIYLLQFVNYYASIFYIAFFKGKFSGHPKEYVRLLTYRQEECGIGGCLMELCIQLAIIMVGKQAFNTILEMIMPIFWRWIGKLRIMWNRKNKRLSFKGKQERWLRDLKLIEYGPRSLFPEYLEMVLQYGFVTIFVAAFPLAPVFALLNNILEMRLDAKKLLSFYRRPVSQRVRDIGVWYRILGSIGRLSVITNGFIIAFTSDFVPRLVYQMWYSQDGSLKGYLNFSLSRFNTSHWQDENFPVATKYGNLTECRYQDFREPPGSSMEYERTITYYLILGTRLAFVVIFENLVALVMIVVRWCIPDMPTELRDQIRREAYITNEIIIKQETLRARSERTAEPRSAPVDLEPNMNFIRMEQLMSGNLSQSQLDLVMHTPDDPTAPSHCPPNKYLKRTNTQGDTATEEDKPTTDDADMGPVSV